MAIHVRCLKLNLPRLNNLITVAANKQTDTSNNRNCLQHSFISKNSRGSELANPFIRSSALLKANQAEKRICKRKVPATSVYPITDNVTSLIPLPDNTNSLVSCQICCYGRTLASIEHLIGCKHLFKPVELTDDLIIVDNCRGELKAIFDILYEDKHQSDMKGDVDWTILDKSAYRNKDNDDNITLCSDLNQNSDKNTEPADNPKQKLLQTKDILEKQMEAYLGLGTKKINWHIFTPDVVLENNYFGKNEVHRSAASVSMQILKYRSIVAVKFCNHKVVILRITAHPEDMTIKIRWRLIGHGYINFLKIPYKNYKGINMDNEGKWYDGFSTFHVQDDGRVYKIRVDRIMPDEEPEEIKSGSMAAKLVAALGVVPKTSLTDFQGLFYKGTSLDKGINL